MRYSSPSGTSCTKNTKHCKPVRAVPINLPAHAHGIPGSKPVPRGLGQERWEMPWYTLGALKYSVCVVHAFAMSM